MKKIKYACYCDTWKRFGSRPDTVIPLGYCGTCHICRDWGHTSNDPPYGRIGDMIGWCDRCFLVERHRPGKRQAEVYIYSAGHSLFEDEERIEIAPPFREETIDYLTRMVAYIHDGDSRMFVKFENGIGIDFWLTDDGELDMSFGDPTRAFWGVGTVDASIAAHVIKVGAAGGDLRDALNETEAEIEYFAEYKPPAHPPGGS